MATVRGCPVTSSRVRRAHSVLMPKGVSPRSVSWKWGAKARADYLYLSCVHGKDVAQNAHRMSPESSYMRNAPMFKVFFIAAETLLN